MGLVTTATLAPPRQAAAVHPARAGLVQAWQVLALAGFAAWVLTIGAWHEPWFDEAQSWLLARDNASLWTLLAERVRYEGTPGLWQALLWVAIRLGLPFDHFYWLPAGFAIAGAAVVLLRAPFPPWLRVALLGSYFFGYQFSVLARSYCLDLLLVPLAACFFADRAARPLRYALVVGLIANANAHGFVAAAVLGADLAWQVLRTRPTPRGLIALALVGGLGLFALWTVWQPADNSFLAPGAHPNPLTGAVASLFHAFIDRALPWTGHSAGRLDLFVGILASLLVPWPLVRLALAGNNRLVTLATFAAPIAFSAAIYGMRWHAGVVFLIWVFALWINWNTIVSPPLRRAVVGVIAGVCLFQGVQTVHSGLLDLTTAYASGQPAAQALAAWRATHPGSRIDGFTYTAFSVQPWLPGNPYTNYHHGAPSPAYMTWSRRDPWPASIRLEDWRRELAGGADLIVAGRTTVGSGIGDLLPTACHMGYGIERIFPAAAIWRGTLAADETLYFYRRGATGGCTPGSPLREPPAEKMLE
jgi:hypothetical protein